MKTKVDNLVGKARVYHPNEGVRRASDATVGAAKMKNMYIDRYTGTLSSFPGYRRLAAFGGKIHTILSVTHEKKEYIYLHAGEGLYRFSKEERDVIGKLKPIAYLGDTESIGLSLGDRLIISTADSVAMVQSDGSLRFADHTQKSEGCTAMAVYDKRLFFAVGEKIVYSTPFEDSLPECLYDGEIISIGAQITALLSGEGGLWVFSNSGVTRLVKSSSIAEPYTADRYIGGISCLGGGIFSSGRLIFLSEGCINLLDDKLKLIQTDLINTASRIVGMFESYAVILSGNDILLFDTLNPSGAIFPLSGIGSYSDERRVYRYSSIVYEGFEKHQKPGSVASGEIISFTDADGQTIYYEKRGKKKYRVRATEEFSGGIYHPINAILCSDGLFLLGSESGELLTVNSDKRGKDGRIPKKYYAFGRRAAEYIIEFHRDDCDLDSLTKDTLPASLTLKLLPRKGSKIDLKVVCDGRTVYSKTLPADRASVTASERQCGWLEKRIIISGRYFASPIFLRSASFRYKVGGRVRNTI